MDLWNTALRVRTKTVMWDTSVSLQSVNMSSHLKSRILCMVSTAITKCRKSEQSKQQVFALWVWETLCLPSEHSKIIKQQVFALHIWEVVYLASEISKIIMLMNNLWESLLLLLLALRLCRKSLAFLGSWMYHSNLCFNCCGFVPCIQLPASVSLLTETQWDWIDGRRK